MNFEGFKEFKREQGKKLEDVMEYLSLDLASAMRALRAGLQKLRFQDNFETFEVVLSIPAGVEQPIRNQFRNAMPSYWLAMRKNKAGLSVCDGDTAWTMDYLYLKNTHATDTATVTVVFFR